MNLGDLLDGAFKLFVANWRTVLVVAGIFLVPLQLLAAWLQRDVFSVPIGELFTDPTAAQAWLTEDAAGEDLAALVGTAATVLILPFVAGAVSRVVAASYLGEQIGWAPALRAAAGRWWALVASRVLVYLLEGLPFLVGVAVMIVGAMVGSIALVALGGLLLLAAIPVAVAIMAFFVATAPAIVVERLGPLAGMRRAAGLARGRLLHVLVAAVVSGILAWVLSMIISAPFSGLGLFLGETGGWVLVGVGSIVGGLFTTPFVAIVATLIYFDGRIRHEAFDLETVAASLGSPHRHAAPPWS